MTLLKSITGYEKVWPKKAEYQTMGYGYDIASQNADADRFNKTLDNCGSVGIIVDVEALEKQIGWSAQNHGMNNYGAIAKFLSSNPERFLKLTKE